MSIIELPGFWRCEEYLFGLSRDTENESESDLYLKMKDKILRAPCIFKATDQLETEMTEQKQ